ncbi:MAG: HD domain-containing protein [Candidatus Omnitrophica bacterium]|nr:HD domain-containing protein [Candidatus Omnitrophota bacterium]
MPKAVIDIGSNSIKLAIGEISGNKVEVIEFLKNIVGLGKSAFYKGVISQEAIQQTVTILRKYKDKLKEYKIAPSEVKVIATTAIREAGNRDIFIDNVQRKTDLKVDILDVGTVSYYIESYFAHKLKSKFAISEETFIIAELGTGGLDISCKEKGYTLFNMSLPIGTLRLASLIGRLGGSLEENMEATADYIDNEFSFLKKNIRDIKIDDVILIDENYARLVQNIIKSGSSGENLYKFTSKEIERMIEKLRDKNFEEISHDYKIPIEIADTILAYAVVLENFCSLIKKGHIHIIDISLSEAVLANMLFDVKLFSELDDMKQLVSEARFVCRKYGLDIEHPEHVARLSGIMFEAMKEYLGLKSDDKKYIILASYLHDIGIFIYNRSHHKHSEYILQYLNFVGLSEEEQKVIACVARYHRRATPQDSHYLYSSLPYDRKILVHKLSAILRITNALDATHKQKVKKFEVVVTKDENFILNVHTNKNFIIEKSEFMLKRDYFREITGSDVTLSIKAG